MTTAQQPTHPPLYLPALRGGFGSWDYFACLMKLGDVAERLSYAEEIHTNKELSDMIQRRVKKGRGAEIAKYLKDQKERFFNALVVAVYGGDPQWHEIAVRNTESSAIDVSDIPPSVRSSVSLLHLNGSEQLYTLDGQHRLAGIRQAIKDGSVKRDEEVTVIFVSHKRTSEGMERTRRLFTTLNKTAKPVAKADIIALDEDDAMAICTRWLVERYPGFSGKKRILYKATNNIPANERECFTTIGTLYDVLGFLFVKFKGLPKKPIMAARLPEPDLRALYKLSTTFFDELADTFPEVGDFMKASRPETVVSKARRATGGHLLFRPVGLSAFTEAAAEIAKRSSLQAALRRLGKLKLALEKPPFVGVLWDGQRGLVITKGRAIARDLILYMSGHNVDQAKLQKKYTEFVGPTGMPWSSVERLRS